MRRSGFPAVRKRLTDLRHFYIVHSLSLLDALVADTIAESCDRATGGVAPFEALLAKFGSSSESKIFLRQLEALEPKVPTSCGRSLS